MCVRPVQLHSQLSIPSRHNITHHSRTTDTKDYARTSLHRRFSALILNFSIFLSGNFLSISTSKQSDRPAEVISSLNANMTPESCSSSDNFGLTRSSRGSVHSSEKNCRFAIVDLIYRELRPRPNDYVAMQQTTNINARTRAEPGAMKSERHSRRRRRTRTRRQH